MTLAVKKVEKSPVLDQGDLDRFDDAGPQVTRRQGIEKGEIVDHRIRGGESAEKVLAAKGIDPVFDSDPGIVLAENGGGNAHQAQATVGGGRRKTDRIEHRAAADGKNERLAAEVVVLDDRMQPLQDARVILAPFAPLDHNRWCHKFHDCGMTSGIIFESMFQVGAALQNPGVDKGENSVASGAGLGEEIGEDRLEGYDALRAEIGHAFAELAAPPVEGEAAEREG